MGEASQVSDPVRAYCRSRPVRVAYLVDEHADDWSAMLEAIFAECMGRWGGRFSLIVPSSPGGLRQSYGPWLEAFDPDVIYSYVGLGEAAVVYLHEWLFPSSLVRHEFFRADRRDAHDYRPRLPIAGLSVVTVLPRAAAPRLGGARGVRIIDAFGRMRGEAFARDSFGFFTASMGRSFAPPLDEYGDTLTVIQDDEAQPRQRYFRDDAQTVSSIASLLDAMASSRVVVSMSQLSAMAVPRLEIRTRRAEAFNLVIGDAFADQIFYWNARSLFPKWRDGDFVDLRLPESAIDDPALISALGNLLRERNHVSGSSSSTPRVVLRSCSVAQHRLESLATDLRGDKAWMDISVGSVASLDDCVPTKEELKRSSYVVLEGLFTRAMRTWHETQASGSGVQLAPSAPEHLRYCPPQLASPHSGCWAVDVDVERHVDYSRYTNVRQRWRLPRRLRVTRSFAQAYEIAATSVVTPRVEQGGLLTVYADAVSKLPTIRYRSTPLAWSSPRKPTRSCRLRPRRSTDQAGGRSHAGVF